MVVAGFSSGLPSLQALREKATEKQTAIGNTARPNTYAFSLTDPPLRVSPLNGLSKAAVVMPFMQAVASGTTTTALSEGLGEGYHLDLLVQGH